MEPDEEWGQLVSLTDIETPPILIGKETFTFGRAGDCDFSLADNKLVSGHHCKLSRDSDGKVWLSDSSTNGTLLNMEYKITKGNRKQIDHGDEFYLVYKKNSEELNVGFVYQETSRLREEEGTQEYSPPSFLDATLSDIEANAVSPSKLERKRKTEEAETSDKPPEKKPKPEESSEASVTAVPPSETTAGEGEIKTTDTEQKTSTDVTGTVLPVSAEEKKAETEKCQVSKAEESSGRDDLAENLLCIICQEIMHDCISLQPCLHSFCAGCYSDWMSRSQECPSCRKKVQRVNKNHIVNNLIEAYLREHPDKKRPEEDIKELEAKNKITKDMLYPKRSDSYTDSSDYEDSDDESPPSPVHQVLPLVNPPIAAPPVGGQLFGFGVPFFGVQRPARTVCRQCPEYKEPAKTGIIQTALNTVKQIVGGVGGGATTDTPPAGAQPGGATEGGGGEPEPGGSGTGGGPEAGPSAKEVDGNEDQGTKLPYKDDPKEMPIPLAYVCVPNQNHVLCQCCLQPMPDRRNQFALDPDNNRPQQCFICYRAFCHAYWGCRKDDCLGCLDKFKDMNFGRKSLLNLILDNPSESNIFRDYIDMKKMSVKDVLQECIRKMESGNYTCPDQARQNFTSNSAVCYPCGLRNFKALALQYRKSIPKNQLPEAAQKRPDCYWGQNCRTQRNKPHHAANFNHVCDQTRQY